MNTPTNAKIIAAVQSGIPLSIMYVGICVATKAICQPQTKNPKVKNIKLLLLNASIKASLAVWLLLSLFPTGVLGVLINKAVIRPIPKRKQKYKIVISHPISINEYLTSKGDTKKPNDPAQVTMPVAIVLFDPGKCYATTDTGKHNAVPPRPIPINKPIVNVK